ncbi:MAG: hypothetical protein GTO09_11620 [Candidatus Latescibacteria bacterium]|nr:hypothetical protein [Candidatus Latescibacterota bacterium]
MVTALALSVSLSGLMSCGKESPLGSVDSGGRDTIGGPAKDSLPPQPVIDPVLTYSDTAMEAYIEWTAPWDDSPQETVHHYEMRFSYTHAFKAAWDIGIVIPDPPVPLAPGERQRHILRYPLRGRTLYAAIRSVDEAGNRSSVDSVASVHILGYTLSGRCVDVLTGTPIEGLAIRIAASAIYNLTTNSDGRFSLIDVSPGAAVATISTGASSVLYHAVKKRFDIVDDLEQKYLMIPFQEMQLHEELYRNILTLFKALTRTSSVDMSTVLATWTHRPVKCYIPSYVNVNGIDYEAEGRAAAQRWMDVAGFELFTFVDSPPDTGVTVHYKSRSQMGIQIGITRHTDGADGHPIRDDIDLVNDMPSATKLYKIFMHELGHTIRLGHLDFSDFIMYRGTPLPDDITEDETKVVKLLVALPSRIDMAIYDESNP